MLVDLARATDRDLRRAARALAAEVLVPLARRGGGTPQRGVRRLATVAGGGLELDLDATVQRLASRPSPGADDMRWRAWRRPGRAYVLVIDASGSVTGPPLATAVVSAAALVSRLAPDDELAVIAFWSRPVVLRSVGESEPASRVLDRLFDLRGGDTTDLAAALRAAVGEASLARCPSREVIVLTDGMANAGADPLPVASTAATSGARLHVLGLSEEPDAVGRCRALAGAGGGGYAPLLRPSSAPAALACVLDGADSADEPATGPWDRSSSANIESA